ncbi:MAG: LysR family transcriptional regulator [Oscillospiraceae bacterium]|nr:LysR family transcriptional regulator [Oscillospiraceae bacterium]
MNINFIRYALEIDRCGSINRAAKQLFISQSSLSRGIKELEAEIGIRIFTRSSAGIITTHQGREFLNHAQKLEMQCKHLEEMYFSGYQPDVLHLSVSSVRYSVACRALIQVYLRHSDCGFQNICFEEGSVEEVIDHIYDGLFSIGIVISPVGKRDYWMAVASNRDLSFTVLDTQNAYIFIGDHHPLASQSVIRVEQLMDYPHATMAQSDVSPIYYCSGVNNYDFRTVARRILVSDRAALYDILRDTNAYYVGLNLGDTSRCTNHVLFKPIEGADVLMDSILIRMKQHHLTSIETEYVEEVKAIILQQRSQGAGSI